MAETSFTASNLLLGTHIKSVSSPLEENKNEGGDTNRGFDFGQKDEENTKEEQEGTFPLFKQNRETSQSQLIQPQSTQKLKGQSLFTKKSIVHQLSNETNNNSLNELKPIQSRGKSQSGIFNEGDPSLTMAISKLPLQEKNTIGAARPSKLKRLQSILPPSFQKIAIEKSVEQNITKMVQFVKFKKQLAEMKRNVLTNSFIKSMLLLTGNPFNEILGDKASYFQADQDERVKFFSSGSILFLYGLINKLIKKLPTIEPSSKFKLIWDLLIATILMTYFFFIPVHVAINNPLHQLITIQLGGTLHSLMGVDIFFSMITGYFEKGIIIQNKKKIFSYYIKNFFWSDILAQIPLLISELGSSDSQLEKIFVMFFFVKLRNFQKIFRKLEESFHLSPRNSNLISLVKLVLVILFFAHAFACLWLLVANSQDSDSTTWLTKINMQNQDWKEQYIAAYYFSTVTMITVGYGDINPYNNLERLVSICTMLISCIIFAYTINQIGTIFAEFFSQDRQLKEFFYIINDYMDNKNIGFSLQYKIREYLDFYWREQDQNKSDLEKKIIDSLSDQLREKLMVEANKLVLKDSGIFCNNFNSSIILKMVPIIQTIHTTPNQVIFQEGQIDEDMFIYFIEKGKVEVCREFISIDGSKVAKPISTLGPGNSFGVFSFVSNQERREMVRSLEFTKLLMVSRKDFLELIKQNPNDVEKFYQLRDILIMENNGAHLELKCNACYSFNHEVQHCKHFHYSPDKYVIAQRNNLKFKSQERDENYSRKRYQVSLKQLFDIKNLKASSLLWKSENLEQLEQYILQYLHSSPHYHNNRDSQYEDQIYTGQTSQDSEDYDDEEFTEEYSSEDSQTQSESLNHSSSSKSQEDQSIIIKVKNKKKLDQEAIKEEEEREDGMTVSNFISNNGSSHKNNQDNGRLSRFGIQKSEEFDQYQQQWQQQQYQYQQQFQKSNLSKSGEIRKKRVSSLSEQVDKEETLSNSSKNESKKNQHIKHKKSIFESINLLQVNDQPIQNEHRKFSGFVTQESRDDVFHQIEITQKSDEDRKETENKFSSGSTPKQLILKVPSLNLEKSTTRRLSTSSRDNSPQLICLDDGSTSNNQRLDTFNLSTKNYKDIRQLEFENDMTYGQANQQESDKNSQNQVSLLNLPTPILQFNIPSMASLVSEKGKKKQKSNNTLKASHEDIDKCNYTNKSQCSSKTNIHFLNERPSPLKDESEEIQERSKKTRNNIRIKTGIPSERSPHKRRTQKLRSQASFSQYDAKNQKSDPMLDFSKQARNLFNSQSIEDRKFKKKNTDTELGVKQEPVFNRKNTKKLTIKMKEREEGNNNLILHNYTNGNNKYENKLESLLKDNSNNSKQKQSRRSSCESPTSSSSVNKNPQAAPQVLLRKKSNLSKFNKEFGFKIQGSIKKNPNQNSDNPQQLFTFEQNEGNFKKSKSKGFGSNNSAHKCDSIAANAQQQNSKGELSPSSTISLKQSFPLKSSNISSPFDDTQGKKNSSKKDENFLHKFQYEQHSIILNSLTKNMKTSHLNFRKQESPLETASPFKQGGELQKSNTQLQLLQANKQGISKLNVPAPLKPQKSFEKPSNVIETLSPLTALKVSSQLPLLQLPINSGNQQQQQSHNNINQYISSNSAGALTSGNTHTNFHLQGTIGEYELLHPKNQIYSIMDFDGLKNFIYYFPKFNSNRIVQKVNVIINNNIMKNLKKSKKLKLFGSKRFLKLEDVNSPRRSSIINKKGMSFKKVVMGSDTSLGQQKEILSIQTDEKKVQSPIEEELSLTSLEKSIQKNESIVCDTERQISPIKFSSQNIHPKSLFKK